MKHLLGLVSLALGATAACAATPSVDPSGVTLAVDASSKVVTIGYTLTGAPAIVTVDIQTNVAGTANWATIGAKNFRHVGGEVNKVVKSLDTPLSITWRPLDDWPGHAVEANALRAVVKAWDLATPPDYMVVNLQGTGAAMRRFYTCEDALPKGIGNCEDYRMTSLVMRRIPANGVVSRIGSPSTEADRSAAEVTRYVTFTNDFYMAVFEMTHGQLWSFVGDWTYGGSGDAERYFPAACCSNMSPQRDLSYSALRGSSVNWPADGHAVAATSVLGKLRTATGIGSFDLPTEALWEYACRAGTATCWHFGASSAAIDDYAWQSGNAGGARHTVGTRQPNPWGLYDMCGNVLEWCLDGYEASPSPNDGVALVDPPGPASCTKRIKKGGGFSQPGKACRSAYKDSDSPTYVSASPTDGFRVCCDANVNTYDK